MSSITSSSDHFLVDREVTKVNNLEAIIGGTFASGAIMSRFYQNRFSFDWVLIQVIVRTRKVAMMTLVTFSFAACLACSVSKGIRSKRLSTEVCI
jgi:hypothetical protein